MGKLGNWKEEGYQIKIGPGFHHRDGTEYVIDVLDKLGNEVGYFKMNHWINHPDHGEILHVMEAEVFTKHRRKGIASAVYSLMEESLGVKIRNEPDQQSESAKAFWTSRNK